MTDSPRQPRRVLLHLEPGLRVPVEPDEVFLLESDGDETRVRTRGRRRLRDVRSLGEVLARFPTGLFVQVHRSAAVNVDRIAEVRRRENGRDWELRLEPPVNSVVPVGRTRLAALYEGRADPDPGQAGRGSPGRVTPSPASGTRDPEPSCLDLRPRTVTCRCPSPRSSCGST